VYRRDLIFFFYIGKKIRCRSRVGARINDHAARKEGKRSEAARINDHAARKEEKKIRETTHKEEKKNLFIFLFQHWIGSRIRIAFSL